VQVLREPLQADQCKGRLQVLQPVVQRGQKVQLLLVRQQGQVLLTPIAVAIAHCSLA